MNRLIFTVPLAGLLLLAIVATAPGVIAEAVTQREAWRVDFELRPEMPRCWSLPVFSYCRVDHTRGAGERAEHGSIHFLTLAPLPEHVRLIRAGTWWGRVTVATALDRLRERTAIVMGLIVLLGLLIQDFVVSGARQLAPEADLATRMAAAGWRASPSQVENTPPPPHHHADHPAFGRRH